MTIEQLETLCEWKHDLEALQNIEDTLIHQHWVTITVPEQDGGKMQFASEKVIELFHMKITDMRRTIESLIEGIPFPDDLI